MSQQAEITVVSEVIKARGYHPIGAMAITSQETVHVFKTNLAEYSVFGALRLKRNDEDDGYELTAKFSMCKSGCKDERGRSLAIGRVMQANGSQAHITGDLHLELIVHNFLTVKTGELESLLKSYENNVEDALQAYRYAEWEFEEQLGDFI